METNVQKWGNSLGIRIPQHLAQQLNLQSGSAVEIKIEEGHISIYPVKYCLKSMLEQITDENKHGEEWADELTVGKEKW